MEDNKGKYKSNLEEWTYKLKNNKNPFQEKGWKYL